MPPGCGRVDRSANRSRPSARSTRSGDQLVTYDDNSTCKFEMTAPKVSNAVEYMRAIVASVP